MGTVADAEPSRMRITSTTSTAHTGTPHGDHYDEH